MDISLLLGIIIGFAALVFGFTLEHGVIQSLFLLSPFVIVMGGTVGAVIASFSLKDIGMAVRSMLQTFRGSHTTSTEKLISKIAEVSEVYRREGMKGMEKMISQPDFQTEEYLLFKEGIVLIESTKTPEEIQYTLESDIRSYTQRKQIEISVWESAAGYSPTMGIIGTVMGLILVLAAGFSNPTELASSIATAFVSTLYGVSFANLIYLPIANKLKSNLRRTKIQREMIVDGVCMIARGDPSRAVENALSLYYQAFADGGKKYRAGIDN